MSTGRIRQAVANIRRRVPMGIVRSNDPVSEMNFRAAINELIAAIEDIDQRLEKLEREEDKRRRQSR